MSDQLNMGSMRAMMKAQMTEQLEGIAKRHDIKAIANDVAPTRSEVRAGAARVDKVDEEMADSRYEIDKLKLGGARPARPPRMSTSSAGSSISTRSGGNEGSGAWCPCLRRHQAPPDMVVPLS